MLPGPGPLLRIGPGNRSRELRLPVTDCYWSQPSRYSARRARGFPSPKGAAIAMPEESTEHAVTQSVTCSKCSCALDSRWSFCPQCGAVSHATVLEKREKSSARDALGGMLFGVLTAPVCLIVGGMLCCTLLGAFAGVPLILLGILAPLLGTVLGLYELHGKCPWCGTRMISLIQHPHDATCPVCGKGIAIHAEKLEKAA